MLIYRNSQYTNIISKLFFAKYEGMDGEVPLSVVTSPGQALTDLTQTWWKQMRETANTNKIVTRL